MKISRAGNSASFGKTAVLSCMLKQQPGKDKVSATLYKMDPHKLSDIDDVRYSKNTRCIRNDFFKAVEERHPNREFYLLQNDKTKEVICCAQTSHHFRSLDAQNPGLSTLIDEIGVNYNYVNGAEPMLAYIVKRAGERFDSTVYTAFTQDELPSLKRAKFSKTNLGEFYIPEKRYNTLIDQAERRSQIEYLV